MKGTLLVITILFFNFIICAQDVPVKDSLFVERVLTIQLESEQNRLLLVSDFPYERKDKRIFDYAEQLLMQDSILTIILPADPLEAYMLEAYCSASSINFQLRDAFYDGCSYFSYENIEMLRIITRYAIGKNKKVVFKGYRTYDLGKSRKNRTLESNLNFFLKHQLERKVMQLNKDSDSGFIIPSRHKRVKIQNLKLADTTALYSFALKEYSGILPDFISQYFAPSDTVDKTEKRQLKEIKNIDSLFLNTKNGICLYNINDYSLDSILPSNSTLVIIDIYALMDNGPIHNLMNPPKTAFIQQSIVMVQILDHFGIQRENLAPVIKNQLSERAFWKLKSQYGNLYIDLQVKQVNND